jgi:transposase
MAVADRNGLPIAIRIASGETHEATLALKTIQSCFTEDLRVNLIGDKAYDSAALRDQMSSLGIELISPRRSGRLLKTQGGGHLRRY